MTAAIETAAGAASPAVRYPPRPRRRRWPRWPRWPLMAVLALAGLHMLVFDRGLGGDGWATFAALESIVDDGDLWLENNLRGVTNGIVPRGGHLVMQYPPGILALDLPPFLAGRAADRLLPARWLAGGAMLPPVGRVPRRVFLAAAAIVLARNVETLLGLAWIALALRRLGFGERAAAGAAALAFFGGPLLFYSLVGMTHAPAFALAALLGWLLVRQRDSGSLGLAFAAGATIGLATLVRYGAVAWLPAALLALAASGRPKREPPEPQAAGAGRAAAPLAGLAGFWLFPPLLPVYWHATSGAGGSGWGPPGYGGRLAISLASPANVLFSPRHGLFLFHPALALAAAALAVAAWRWGGRGGAAAVALLWFLSIATFNGWWSAWANAGGWGQRFLTEAMPPLALGFALLLAAAEGAARRWRSAVLGGIAAATAFGYLLFFAAVGGLASGTAPAGGQELGAAGGIVWPQRLSDYRPLTQHPPDLRGLAVALRRASVVVRAIGGGGTGEMPSGRGPG